MRLSLFILLCVLAVSGCGSFQGTSEYRDPRAGDKYRYVRNDSFYIITRIRDCTISQESNKCVWIRDADERRGLGRPIPMNRFLKDYVRVGR